MSAANTSQYFSATDGKARCHNRAVSVQLASARPKCRPSAQRSSTGGRVNNFRANRIATSGGVTTRAIAAAAVQAGTCRASSPSQGRAIAAAAIVVTLLATADMIATSLTVRSPSLPANPCLCAQL